MGSKYKSSYNCSNELVPINKVIDLLSYRKKRAAQNKRTVLYLTRRGRWLSLLESFLDLNVIEVRSNGGLSDALINQRPESILVDANIDWGGSISLINELHTFLEVPIILFCEAKTTKQDMKLAYLAGASEVLRGKVTRDDLSESLNVLFKINSSISK